MNDNVKKKMRLAVSAMKKALVEPTVTSSNWSAGLILQAARETMAVVQNWRNEVPCTRRFVCEHDTFGEQTCRLPICVEARRRGEAETIVECPICREPGREPGAVCKKPECVKEQTAELRGFIEGGQVNGVSCRGIEQASTYPFLASQVAELKAAFHSKVGLAG
jgi:hypothetical protein